MDRSHELLTRELLVLVRSTEGIEEGTLSQETDVSLLSVTDQDGHFVLPAFTTETALSRWATPGAPFLGLPGRTVLDLLASETAPWNRMVVDTGSRDEFAVTADEARNLLMT